MRNWAEKTMHFSLCMILIWQNIDRKKATASHNQGKSLGHSLISELGRHINVLSGTY